MTSTNSTQSPIELQPFYHDLRNQLVNPTDVMICSHYFFREWKPRLGPVLSLLIMELRDRCYRNKATGEVRNTCWPSQTELARSLGVSVNTIARALKGEVVSLFVRVEPRYRYDPIRKKKIRTSSIYHVAIDDPLLPEDETVLNELITNELAVDTSPKPQNGGQDSSPKMEEEEVYEEYKNVNDRKILSEEGKGRREYLAKEIAKSLGDEQNLGCYLKVAESIPEPILFETLSIVKDIARQGKIKKSKGALFIDLIKRKANLKRIPLGLGSDRGSPFDDPKGSSHQSNG
jgi:DNA-binding XRE family transcriptional regulator